MHIKSRVFSFVDPVHTEKFSLLLILFVPKINMKMAIEFMTGSQTVMSFSMSPSNLRPVLAQKCLLGPPKPVLGQNIVFNPVPAQECHFRPPQASSGIVMSFSSQFWCSRVILDPVMAQ